MSTSLESGGALGAGSAIPFNYTTALSGIGVTNTPQIATQDLGSNPFGLTPEAPDNPTNPLSLLTDSGSQLAQDVPILGSLGATDGTSLSNDLYNLTGGLAGTKKSGQSSGIFDGTFWTDLFLRSVVIITGFIFVAAGLRSFGNNQNAVVALKSTVGLGK